jgi:U6 snRNA-associated Sm-like protein LSm8
LTLEGRNIVGVMKGYDMMTNLILADSHERIFSEEAEPTVVPLGLYVIRGDNIAVVGELDEEVDLSRDLSRIRAPPIKPVVHTAH